MTDRSSSLMSPILIAGCVLILVSFAIRASFGVFQIPIAEDLGWLRVEFSMAIAIQNLAWGVGQPIFGALAERIGDRVAIIVGALLYAAGLGLIATAGTPLAMQAYSAMTGFGIAGTGFGLVLAVVGRAAADEHRSMALGIATAAGSVGQVIGAPLAQWMMTFTSWPVVFMVFAASMVAVLGVLPLMRVPPVDKPTLEQSLGPTLRRAFRDPSYSMIAMGFFSCGYQLGFITAHFPAMVAEMCGPILPGSVLHSLGLTTTSALGATALAVIGLANIAGSIGAGWLGQRYPRKYLLAGVYTGRTIFALAFILTPITPASVLHFSVGMGSLWLATIPLTTGLIAHIYGLRFMGTLYGFVFLSHQIGSFLGIWLGGRLYDVTGDYTLVWWVGIAVGAFSALVHLPVREARRPLAA